MWPFKKPTLEQIEDRRWKKYRNNLALTLADTGYRGYPVSLKDAYAWADGYVAEARARQAAWAAEQ